VVFESETNNGLTAAGTAPVLHRIPFSLPIPDVEWTKPKNEANIRNLLWFFDVNEKKPTSDIFTIFIPKQNCH